MQCTGTDTQLVFICSFSGCITLLISPNISFTLTIGVIKQIIPNEALRYTFTLELIIEVLDHTLKCQTYKSFLR